MGSPGTTWFRKARRAGHRGQQAAPGEDARGAGSKRAAEVAAAREMAKRLEKVSCTITVKTGEDDKLFGSVTASHIADVLKAQGVELEKHSLLLEAPIRELGVYDVKVKLSADVEGSVKVWVVQE